MQSRVILINPRYRVWSPSKWVPLGLGYIAAVLEKEGCTVEIIDLSAEKVSDKELQRQVGNADIVGINGIITEFQEVLKLVKLVKEAKGNIKIILGGPLATTLTKELLEVSSADVIVLGEGEKTIVNLLSAINENSDFNNVRGIAYKDGNQIIITEKPDHITDLDSIPFPSRHLLNMNQYLQNHFENIGIQIKDSKQIRSTNLITSRGCPFGCTFCFKDMWGSDWRARSPENIIEEMMLLHEKYGVNGFFFNDDTFVLDSKRVFKFCQLLKSKGLDVVWDCNGRVNLMTKELLEAMHDAGCRSIAYGIESGNQVILDSIKKSITLEQIRKVVKWTKDAGIHTTGYFMIGMIGETKDTIRQTFTFAKELNL
ncbi:MAG: radical SAM protein, partial [Dehalococcoidales bacterium]|nr:radical SAM protein [Dehalococcoidales bacterium]